ncbi:efflux transporter outer membrane subunit [Seohaeicola zhoushanensis]|uniref:RND transporter n=1 Tax=Seohaeicola zhoushanensis TaxID=1569283 RepID=A0A8J3M914_9RHOB|nr:efflux transporter outer membrane subunit [Seohaeicola zhoushanensis]GHF64347.1 RND transporter [Seohaeicola zhoushanensis]
MKPVFLAVTLLATACTTVGPQYKQPEMALAARFTEATASQLGEIATRQWWTGYNDAMLNELVARGLRQNLDIAGAMERIRAAEANLRGTGLPAAISGALSASSIKAGSDTTSSTTSQNRALSAGLVLDLFGGIRRSREGAEASLGAAQANEGTARLAYLAALIGAYIDARYYQESLALTRGTIASREETLRITQQKFDAGSATELDLAQVRALLYAARASIPTLEANFLARVYTIATLLGEPADPILAQMRKGRAQPRPRGSGGVGIPADLLRNRPDVRSAEMSLMSATAAVGVAESNLRPSISLSGSVSGTSNTTWSFGPTLTLPILKQPALRASRDAAISAAKQAEISWRSTVLGAVEDVQSANSRWVRDRQSVGLLGNSVEAYARALQLSRQSYEQGALSLLDLLDTDRSLETARLGLAAGIQSMAVDWATLQVALGAGAYVGSPTPR